MRIDWFVKILLLTIAVSLGAIALRPYIAPPPALAQTEPHPFYIEPGTVMLRAPDGSKNVFGKVMVDLRNGKVWGFPTYTQGVYPVNAASSTPPTAHPFFLGKFALADTDK